MNELISIVASIALLGAALMGGVFFAFSNFVMQALAGVPDRQGMTAMQSINAVVLNPGFLGAFMGTAALSLGVAAFALSDWRGGATLLFLGGAVSYVAGTFLVTLLGNVPLNNRLAAMDPADAQAAALWRYYLHRWTRWNHLRTVAAMASALLYLLGLLH